MKARTLLTTAALIAAALFILDVPAAVATDYYVSVTGNLTTAEWRTESCTGPVMSKPSYPDLQTDDTITICDKVTAVTLTVNSAIDVAAITVQSSATMAMSAAVETDTLTIECDGVVTTGAYTLTITASNGLTIDAVSGDCTDPGLLNVDGAGTVDLTGGGTSQTIDGTLQLSVSGSTLSITTNGCTIDGSGKIEGRNNAARIEIAAEDNPGISLISSIDIVGALEIAGLSAEGKTTGTFTNSGIVDADGASDDKRIIVVSGTIDGGGTWRVSASDAEIQFDVAATGLTGIFDIDAGTLDINENVTTTGDLDFTGGTIDVAPTKAFQAS